MTAPPRARLSFAAIACETLAMGLASLTLSASVVVAQSATTAAIPSSPNCANCAVWNAPQRPFKVYGNSYWVGTHGLGSILITSREGHILIDGALPESAPLIEANIRALGFRLEDVKLILNSHDHFDHAGGIAELQRASGARVAASPASATVLRNGTSGADDPQFGIAAPYPRVATVSTIVDGETLTVGALAVTAHFTPGHTPGGTTWTWQSCENSSCLNIVYADSQTPVSADGFSFSRNTTYAAAISDFKHSATVLDNLPCDILLTPHPDASGLWERIAARDAGNSLALLDRSAWSRYAATARTSLAKRLAAEASKP